MDSAKEIAELLKAKWGVGLDGGVVVANPIPKEYEMDAQLIEEVLKSSY